MSINEKISLLIQGMNKHNAEEMVKIMLKIPEKEQEKLFFMMKGMELAEMAKREEYINETPHG